MSPSPTTCLTAKMTWAHVKSHRLHNVDTPLVQTDQGWPRPRQLHKYKWLQIMQKWNIRIWCKCLVSDLEFGVPARTQWQELMFVRGGKDTSWWEEIGMTKRMGHSRARKIDFTVNLIHPLFSRCPVSRECIKPAHKKVLSSCLYKSSPSNHCRAPTENNRINISWECSKDFWQSKSSICYRIQ